MIIRQLKSHQYERLFQQLAQYAQAEPMSASCAPLHQPNRISVESTAGTPLQNGGFAGSSDSPQ